MINDKVSESIFEHALTSMYEIFRPLYSDHLGGEGKT